MTNKKAAEHVEELYVIFEKFKVTRKEFNRWVREIEIGRKKTEAALVDLFFCPFIKEGLSNEHLRHLSKRLNHKEYRARRLSDRLKYLSECVVMKDNLSESTPAESEIDSPR